jgi:hypothetical protein
VRNIYIGCVLRQIAGKSRLSINKIFDVTVDCLNFSNEERAILRPEENHPSLMGRFPIHLKIEVKYVLYLYDTPTNVHI